MSGGGLRHWVLVETGANQAYIFDTNRLRHVVGASFLVYRLGREWVPEAAARHRAEVVLAISGKALLLVGDPGAGRAVIGEVSLRALREAPGLEVTGVVGPPFDPGLDWRPAAPGAMAGDGRAAPFTHVEALEQTYALLEVARKERPSPLLRDPLLPWMQVCRDSGLPAAGTERHADGGPAAAPVLAKSAARHGAQRRMRDLLAGQSGLVPENLDDLRHDGWIAVVHADGNGVGKVFTEFPRRSIEMHAEPGGGPGPLSLARHAELLHSFTHELELATETALDMAARDATAGADAAGTVLPVVVGGDDVTVVCHARFALALVRFFALAFAGQTAAQPVVSAMTGGGLTASAGIAYVKPHHPFSTAYALAEELAASAKSARQADGRPVAAVDLHVAFESTLADLGTLRGGMEAGGLARHGGPYVITGADGPPGGPRDIAGLDRTIRTVGAMSSSMAHELREGLAIGPQEYALRVGRAARSPDLPAGITRADIEYLAPAPPGQQPGRDGQHRADGAEPVVRLLDAMLLAAVARPAAGAGEVAG